MNYYWKTFLWNINKKCLIKLKIFHLISNVPELNIDKLYLLVLHKLLMIIIDNNTLSCLNSFDALNIFSLIFTDFNFGCLWLYMHGEQIKATYDGGITTTNISITKDTKDDLEVIIERWWRKELPSTEKLWIYFHIWTRRRWSIVWGWCIINLSPCMVCIRYMVSLSFLFYHHPSCSLKMMMPWF